jgi:ABC-type glycerol-3-phosphate transport system substrate-binding protein
MQPIQYAEMGEGLPLDQIIDWWKQENNPILKDYTESMLSVHMFEGKHYGLPVNRDPRQIIYRTYLFKQAGITKLPSNWTEFEDVCAKLKASLPSDVYPFVLVGGGDYSGIHTVISFLVQNDAGPTDKNGEPDYLNPKVTETLQFFNRLYEKGYVPEGVAAYFGADAAKNVSGRKGRNVSPQHS